MTGVQTCALPICIGNDVRINGGPHLPNTDHSLYVVKDGIVVVKKGAIMPDGFVI